MRYFIFNYETDNHLIDSFLISAAKAHGYSEVHSKEWFYWKFRDNPYGESILACAEENGVIVGCVGYGRQLFLLNGKMLNAVLSFETFVHPDFQGHGLFTKLIKLAETKLIEQNIDFILNFPNNNSLKGFFKNGWKQIDPPEYRIRFNNYCKVLFKIWDIRKGYEPNKTNLSELVPFNQFEQYDLDCFHSKLSLDYLNWRFFTFPVTEYIVLKNDNYQSIMKMGKRGTVREAHVLFINIKDWKLLKLKDFLQHCKKNASFDIISFTVSNNNPLKNILMKNMFIKVPSKVHMCYKILNQKAVTDVDFTNISFDGVNHHTN